MGRGQLRFTKKARGRGGREVAHAGRARTRDPSNRDFGSNAFRYVQGHEVSEDHRDVDDLRSYVPGLDVAARLGEKFDTEDEAADLPSFSLDLDSLARQCLALLPAHVRLGVAPEYCEGLKFQDGMDRSCWGVPSTGAASNQPDDAITAYEGSSSPASPKNPPGPSMTPRVEEKSSLSQTGAGAVGRVASLDELLGVDNGIDVTGSSPVTPHSSSDLHGLCDELLGLSTVEESSLGPSKVASAVRAGGRMQPARASKPWEGDY